MNDAIALIVDDARPSGEIDAVSLADLGRATLRGEGVERASISIVIVDNATIREINRRNLGHDWPTDVITFPLSEPGAEVLEAELILSAEMAEETAREVGAEPGDELALYLVHGLLHLCGFDDRAEADASAMRRREDEVLRREGYRNTFGLVGRGASS
jgi:probable rRNA maturation factor